MKDAEHMRSIAHLGGAANKAKGADYFREIGAMGGRAGKGKRKPRRAVKRYVEPPVVVMKPQTAPALETLDSILAELERPR